MSPNVAPLLLPQGRGKGQRAPEAPAFRRGERHNCEPSTDRDIGLTDYV
jgi:hypothetical protein